MHLFQFVKYATAALLVGMTTFFVNVSMCIVIVRTRVVKLTKKVVVLTRNFLYFST